MGYRSDNTSSIIGFLITICSIGSLIHTIFKMEGIVVFISILVMYFLIKIVPDKCIHGKRGKCDNCKEAYLLRKREIELQYQNERLEKDRQYKIQLDIVSNRNEILNQLTVFNSQSIEKMIQQTPYEFENSVANIYKELGYKVRVTSQSNDKGKDIIMFKDGKKYLVECKKYSSANLVNRPELQKFMAAIYEEKAVKGYFVTTSDFTSSAYSYPNDVNNKLELINGKDLMKLFYSVFPSQTKILKYNMVCEVCGDYIEFTYPGKFESFCKNQHVVVSNIEQLMNTKPSPRNNILTKENRCPKCNSTMKKRLSKINRQYFWGCINYPLCNGTLSVKSRNQLI